jgi:hypothetical protein
VIKRACITRGTKLHQKAPSILKILLTQSNYKFYANYSNELSIT